MPRRQRTKIMPTSAMSIMAMPSWPAPLGNSNTRKPSAAMASAICAFSQGAQGAVLMGDVDLQGKLASPGDGFDLPDDVGNGAPAVHVGRRAHVDGEGDLARNDIGRAGPGIDIADRADQTGLIGTAKLLDRADAFGCARECIVPQPHRYGAGMSGHSGQPRRKPRRAGNRGDHAYGEILLLEHRALFDMQFDIAQKFAADARRLADMIGIEPERGDRLAQRHAIAIARAEHALVKGTGNRAAAEQS